MSSTTNTTSSKWPQKVWLITGSTSGFGYELCHYAASRGDKVLAASRNPKNLSPALLSAGDVTPIHLSPNDSFEEINKDVQKALAVYGQIDILILNAAFVTVGAVEERTEAETLSQFQTNFFGVLSTLRAVLPHMRSRRTGTIATIGSMGAHIHTPGIGLYHASKAALRSISLTLRGELAPFGIIVTTIEPGHFRTAVLDKDKGGIKLPTIGDGDEKGIVEYREMNQKTVTRLERVTGRQVGDPKKGAKTIYDVLMGEKEVPEFLVLGNEALEVVKKQAEGILGVLEEWKDVSRGTDFEDGGAASLEG